jgi:peptidoglycan/LPS O-acetylase OafA/YrhL
LIFHLHQNYKMSPELSQKLKNLSFLLMILVAYIHGYNLNVRIGDGGYFETSYWLRFLETFVSDGICRVAVPMFFAISGYLACYHIREDFTWKWYGNLLKKKVFSLLIPYLAVSALGIILVFVLQLFPFSKPFFNNYSIEKTSFLKWLWIWAFSPVPFQLWFLRFLIFYFLLLPLFYYLIKYLKVLFLILLFIIWAYIPWHIYTGFAKIEYEGAFFFCFGMFFSVLNILPTGRIKWSTFLGVFLFWLLWIFYRTYLFLKIDFNPYLVHYHIVGITFVGIFIFWWAYDHIFPLIQSLNWIKRNVGYAFGIFLFHEPFLTIVKKILIRILGVNDWTILITYLFAPVLSIVFAIYLSGFLNSYFKKLYLVLSGRRIDNSSSV